MLEAKDQGHIAQVFFRKKKRFIAQKIVNKISAVLKKNGLYKLTARSGVLQEERKKGHYLGPFLTYHIFLGLGLKRCVLDSISVIKPYSSKVVLA